MSLLDLHDLIEPLEVRPVSGGETGDDDEGDELLLLLLLLLLVRLGDICCERRDSDRATLAGMIILKGGGGERALEPKIDLLTSKPPVRWLLGPEVDECELESDWLRLATSRELAEQSALAWACASLLSAGACSTPVASLLRRRASDLSSTSRLWSCSSSTAVATRALVPATCESALLAPLLLAERGLSSS